MELAGMPNLSAGPGPLQEHPGATQPARCDEGQEDQLREKEEKVLIPLDAG